MTADDDHRIRLPRHCANDIRGASAYSLLVDLTTHFFEQLANSALTSFRPYISAFEACAYDLGRHQFQGHPRLSETQMCIPSVWNQQEEKNEHSIHKRSVNRRFGK